MYMHGIPELNPKGIFMLEKLENGAGYTNYIGKLEDSGPNNEKKAYISIRFRKSKKRS